MFETKRCLLTAFQKSDYADVKKLFRNHEVRKYLGGIQQEHSIEMLLEEMLHSSDNSYYWVVREKHSTNFLGLVSLDPHHDGVYLELSYQFLPSWWGTGFATEVIQVIINYAFNGLGLTKIVAETQTANIASCRILEKIGMKVEKVINRFGAEQAIYSIQAN